MKVGLEWPQSRTNLFIWFDLICWIILLAGEQLVLNPFKPGDPNQQWEHHERHIRNRLQHNNVLDVYGKCRLLVLFRWNRYGNTRKPEHETRVRASRVRHAWNTRETCVSHA